MAPLFCRSLQVSLRQTLTANSQDYQSTVKLSPQAIEDLQWWKQHLTSWNGRSLISPAFTIVIDSDASLQGWGATCKGKSTRGPWSPQEQTLHINCLTATLAVQTFAKGRSSENRQHNRSGVHQQERRDSVPNTFTPPRPCDSGAWRRTFHWKPSTYQKS